MFETNSLHRIGQFDVDAQVVGIEFQLIAFGKRNVFRKRPWSGGRRAIYVKFPVLILFGRRLKIDH